MKIKNVLMYSGVTIALLISLTGCSAKEEIKSVNKENDVASLNLKNNNKTTANGSETVNVTHTDFDAENRYIIVYGYDAMGNITWEYETKKEVGVPQFTALEYFTEDYNTELVYLNELGTIKALDLKTGKEKWTNDEYKGRETLHCVDEKGNLYLFSTTNQVLFIADKEGNTIKRAEIKNEALQVPVWLYQEMELTYTDDNSKATAVVIKLDDSDEAMKKTYEVTIRLDNNKVEVKHK